MAFTCLPLPLPATVREKSSPPSRRRTAPTAPRNQRRDDCNPLGSQPSRCPITVSLMSGSRAWFPPAVGAARYEHVPPSAAAGARLLRSDLPPRLWLTRASRPGQTSKAHPHQLCRAGTAQLANRVTSSGDVKPAAGSASVRASGGVRGRWCQYLHRELESSRLL